MRCLVMSGEMLLQFGQKATSCGNAVLQTEQYGGVYLVRRSPSAVYSTGSGPPQNWQISRPSGLFCPQYSHFMAILLCAKLTWFQYRLNRVDLQAAGDARVGGGGTL